MDTLLSLFPKAENLLATPPEDLGPILLRIVAARRQGSQKLVSLDYAKSDFFYDAQHLGNHFMAARLYPFALKHEIETLLNESWDWLRSNGLITPAPPPNDKSSWMVLTGKGEELLASPDNLQHWREIQPFPKTLLHSRIAERVWAAIRADNLSGAVFETFKAVEEAVRAAGGFSMSDLGVALMRKAFKPGDGPLTDRLQPDGEQEARMHLFAGAIGCYKNPNSHRTDTTELRDAQEQALLASHLLSIVDSRVAAKTQKPSES